MNGSVLGGKSPKTRLKLASRDRDSPESPEELCKDRGVRQKIQSSWFGPLISKLSEVITPIDESLINT